MVLLYVAFLDMCIGIEIPRHCHSLAVYVKAIGVVLIRQMVEEVTHTATHIEKCDIQQYHSEQRFDAIIGNPPFNLKFDFRLSQEYYIDKALKRKDLLTRRLQGLQKDSR